jgi:aminoglycoside 6'-N-acetyltransferase I
VFPVTRDPEKDMDMDIVDLGRQSQQLQDQAAALLHQNFNFELGWPTIESARTELADILRQGFARAAIRHDALLGWVGGLPEYRGKVWELHPIVVYPEARRRGIGRALVAAFEAEARARGGVTATLGTDDDTGITSLADVDLYGNVPRHIAELRDLGKQHPFLFFQKLGFVVTGVMPDANGRGRPDIYMSKSLDSTSSGISPVQPGELR